MTLRPAPRLSDRGMTLIELMIVLVVVGILAAVAWPSLQDAVHKSRRSDAMAGLSRITQAQERWRANQPMYQDTLANLDGAKALVSPDGHYALSLVAGSVSATGYTAQATVQAGSPQSADTRCQVLQVTVAGGNITYSSLAAGNAVNAAPDPCWVR